MDRLQGWTRPTRRSDYAVWSGLGLAAILVSLYTAPRAPRLGTSMIDLGVITLNGIGFIILMGVPMGILILLEMERLMRAHYRFGDDAVTKIATLPYLQFKTSIPYDTIEGVWWKQSRYGDDTGSIHIFQDLEAPPSLRITYVPGFAAIQQLLREKVGDLTVIEEPNGQGDDEALTGGVAAAAASG